MMMHRALAKRSLLLCATPQRATAVTATRSFAARAANDSIETLRPIHFEQEESVRSTLLTILDHSWSNEELAFVLTADAAARPFKIVGVRDVEVLDWEYPTRIETDQKKTRALRNRFNHPNFISLWVDKLALVEDYLKAENIPYASEGIVKGPDGLDVLVIPPSEDGSSVEFFNLCDAPTFVELVQATPEVIKEHEEDPSDE